MMNVNRHIKTIAQKKEERLQRFFLNRTKNVMEAHRTANESNTILITYLNDASYIKVT
jgi:hypothetical protein